MLHSLNLPFDVIKEIVRDIFGVSSVEEQEIGPVDSPNESAFRKKLDEVKSRWDHLEMNNRLVKKDEVLNPEFHHWFVSEKADTMINCMIADVRQKAGMGHDPDHFYTNTCESMNSTIKNRTDFKPHDFRPFVKKMFQLAEAQESLLRKAVIHSDRWKEYEHLEVDQDKWFSMSIKTQKIHLSRVYSEQLGSGPIVVSASNDSNDYINKVKLDVDYSVN